MFVLLIPLHFGFFLISSGVFDLQSGYTPLHVACHFGQMNMVRFLLGHGCKNDVVTSQGYTPLHQAAQQGHPMIVSLLLEHGATPNAITAQGQTALSIAQKLGYITVIETLKVVTETTITTTTTTIIEEKYRVQAPETMQETFMSDSEDEGGNAFVTTRFTLQYCRKLDFNTLRYILKQSLGFAIGSNSHF